jgi:uncharacterized membrane protein HdeD (DUF308 family)
MPARPPLLPPSSLAMKVLILGLFLLALGAVWRLLDPIPSRAGIAFLVGAVLVVGGYAAAALEYRRRDREHRR